MFGPLMKDVFDLTEDRWRHAFTHEVIPEQDWLLKG